MRKILDLMQKTIMLASVLFILLLLVAFAEGDYTFTTHDVKWLVINIIVTVVNVLIFKLRGGFDRL